MRYLLGIDQGTSGSRALIIDETGEVCGYGYRPLSQIHPDDGWAEQDPQAVAAGVEAAITEAIGDAGCRPGDIIGCGIACQRNTDFVWDAHTSRPLANAITWQDLRTTDMLDELTATFPREEQRRRLGFLPGPFCSALHLVWRLRHDDAVIKAAAAGRLRAGFSANWLLAALGTPDEHVTDYTTLQAMGVYDFREGRFWEEWLTALELPRAAFPAPVPTVNEYGTLRIRGQHEDTAEVPVLAIIGDQQAALFGQGRRRPGDAKCTHGTASFVNVFTGTPASYHQHLNNYYAWVLGDEMTYCLEARNSATGSIIQWMVQRAGLLENVEEVDTLAGTVDDAGGVVFVPAFTGLFVPDEDPTARGTIVGLTLGSTRAHIVRAFLEGIAYELGIILERIEHEAGVDIRKLHLDGGVTASDYACQIQADLLGIPVVRPDFAQTTAFAAALLAGMGTGTWADTSDLPGLPGDTIVFEPQLSDDAREAGYARWRRAAKYARGWGTQ